MKKRTQLRDCRKIQKFEILECDKDQKLNLNFDQNFETQSPQLLKNTGTRKSSSPVQDVSVQSGLVRA